MRYSLRSRAETTMMIDVWGQIVVHVLGYRAQYAKIVATVVNIMDAITPPAPDEPRYEDQIVPQWVRRVWYAPALHAENVRVHDANAYAAAEKWDLPVITLEQALQMVEADHADR